MPAKCNCSAVRRWCARITATDRRSSSQSEFLHAFLTTERVRSHLPVQLRQGTSELRVGSIDYDHLTQFARLGPPVRARFEVPRR